MFATTDIEYLKNHWRVLSKAYSKEFAETYKIVHQAVQFLAISGKSVFPPRYDDSHTAFSWDFRKNCFVGEYMHSKRTTRLEFCPQGLKIALVPYGEEEIGSFFLNNKTKKEIYAQLRQLLLKGGIQINNFVTEMHYDMHNHTVCNGGKYSIPFPEYNDELTLHYANAFALLHMLRGKMPRANIIRCWPHHFDLTLNLAPSSVFNSSDNDLILGFSPSNYDVCEPHFYLARHKPENLKLSKKKLKYGFWFADGRQGTFLPLSLLIEKKNPSTQAAMVANFLNQSRLSLLGE